MQEIINENIRKVRELFDHGIHRWSRRDYCSFKYIEDIVSSLLLSMPLYFSFPLFVYSFSVHLSLFLLFTKQSDF